LVLSSTPLAGAIYAGKTCWLLRLRFGLQTQISGILYSLLVGWIGIVCSHTISAVFRAALQIPLIGEDSA